MLHVFADGGYAGDKLKRQMKKIGRLTVEIIKRSDKAKGFEVLPRRWVVERTFAWLGKCRRLAKDVEKSIASSEAWIMIAHIRLITRRLARYCYYRGFFESDSKSREFGSRYQQIFRRNERPAVFHLATNLPYRNAPSRVFCPWSLT